MIKKIGRSEKIAFPDLNIESISAKVDTGAYGIAFHVDGIEILDDRLHFWIGDISNKFEFDKFKTIKVKSSFGEVQKRYSILSRVKVGSKIYKFYISLTDRKDMNHPVLIGRRFLHKFNYIVDVRKKNINDRNKKV